MPTPPKANPGKAGRPPTDKAILDTAIHAVSAGEPIEEVGKRLGVSHMTIRREQDRRRAAARAAASAPPPDPGPVAAPVAPPRAPSPRERPPPGLTGNALQLWYVQRQIEMVSVALADASGPDGQLARIAPLNGELRKWLAELDRLSPKEEADPAAEERRWREEASRVRARVEAGVRAFEEG